ncbi:unnamed protein product [Zymoseptoria tritici ST99CH_1E4]|uniref:Uncharacterized protein n=1 Tax=Zymoseptoria tritici ST99CH_1E4 TaxID=1276532 RepID=A0A2H1GNW4_ZYMTR|nr:unnamed protein product [Zymoseptoria tritici ST99CH_1E4]
MSTGTIGVSSPYHCIALFIRQALRRSSFVLAHAIGMFAAPFITPKSQLSDFVGLRCGSSGLQSRIQEGLMAITPQKSLPETAGTFSLANQTRHLIDDCHSSGSKKSCGRGRDYDAHAAECAIRQLTDAGL